MNIGTPDEATIGSVREYLKEFLLDPDVIDIPAQKLTFQPIWTISPVQWSARSSPSKPWPNPTIIPPLEPM